VNNPINRRAVLKSGTALAAATVAGVVQAQAIEANPDTKLQALYSAYKRADANACDAAQKADILNLAEEESLSLERAVDDAWGVWHGVVDDISSTPAKGLTGLEIKLLVWEEINMQPVKDDSCCALSALKDLKRMNGKIVDVSPNAASNPSDKLLTEAYAKWIKLFEMSSMSDEESELCCDELRKLEKLMIETNADSLAGTLVKEKWLEYPDNFVDEYICPTSFPMFQSLMADVKRIGDHHV